MPTDELPQVTYVATQDTDAVEAMTAHAKAVNRRLLELYRQYLTVYDVATSSHIHGGKIVMITEIQYDSGYTYEERDDAGTE